MNDAVRNEDALAEAQTAAFQSHSQARLLYSAARRMQREQGFLRLIRSALSSSQHYVELYANYRHERITLTMKIGVITRRVIRKRLSRLVSIHTRFDVGRGTYGEPYVYQWGEAATLRVGSFCSIADDVTIFLGGDHRVDWITTYPFSRFRKSAKQIEGHPRTKGDVKIGNDVWIGTGASILSGVTIGDGAVIGAHAVVAKNVSPYTIVVGNPATPVRKRFTDDEIATLERIAWWCWPDSLIDEAMPFLLSNNIAALSAFADKHTGST